MQCFDEHWYFLVFPLALKTVYDLSSFPVTEFSCNLLIMPQPSKLSLFFRLEANSKELLSKAG